MSKKKYLYIDDYADPSIIAIKDGLKDTGIIDVNFVQVKEFKDLITDVEEKYNEYDGYILDLRLDENPKLNVKFSATSLAQEIRNRCTSERGIKDIPIILCSTDKNLQKFYSQDITGHDLFDYRFLKEARPNWELNAERLRSLANGYIFLNEKRFDLDQLFGRKVTELDDRIYEQFLDSESKLPSHVYARYVLENLINKPGPLICDRIVAARLGIDIEASEDWENLIIREFEGCKYKGVFSDTWHRWWSDMIIQRFFEITQSKISSLNAESRVELIQKHTGLDNLIPAKPIAGSISSSYWTICQYYLKPLDPLEGFRIVSKGDSKPWHDKQYISFEAAAERLYVKKGLKIESSEEVRLKLVIEQMRSSK